MAAHGAVPDRIVRSPARPPSWIRFLLGGVMILAGAAILADVALASIVSSAFIGTVAIIVGGFEIAHAAWTKGWGGLAWQMLLGLIYVVVGLVLIGVTGSSAMVLASSFARSTGAAELLLTYALGLLLILSGAVRLLLGFSYWRTGGWIMLSSGVFGILAGLVVLAEFPKSGLWIFGLLLGIDLISHGLAWLGHAFLPMLRKS